MQEVAGWFAGMDADLFEVVHAAQAVAGMTGNILEIGAFEGKSAILLGYFVRDGETVHVCDLFESDAPAEANRGEMAHSYADLRRGAFERNYREFHRSLPVIHQLPSQDLLPELETDSFRLAHVDGSHLYEIVRQDIATARVALGDGGVVIFDDYRNRLTPGVSAAVWQACAAEDEPLVPLMLSEAKFYGTFSSRTALDLRSQLEASGMAFDVVPFGDRDVLRPRRLSTGSPMTRQRIVRALTPPAVGALARRLRRARGSK